MAAVAVQAPGTHPSGAQDPRGSVVKIFNTAQRPGWVVPWQARNVESSTGSGAVVELPSRDGGSGPARIGILTAAHVVADTRFLQVQRSADRFGAEKTVARVAAVCHENDLALLEVADASFLGDIVPLRVGPLDALPRVFDKVLVVGYPVGGGACSITEGVLNRIEVQQFSHSLRAGLALTVDAAINSGNSGGPVLCARTSEVIGVAFQKMVARGVELQGHAVPAPLIRMFLAEAVAGRRPEGEPPLNVRLPALGCDFQTLESPALRRKLGLGKSHSGVLVTRLRGGAPTSLSAGDVMLRFNGHELDNTGFCKVLGQRLHFAAARDLCHVGESITLTVWREGKEVVLEQKLAAARYLVPRGQHDVAPPFFVCGGLVFQPLSFEYLQAWSSGSQPSHLSDLFIRGTISPDREEVVLLTQILADEVNQGYGTGFIGAPSVTALNGQTVRSLEHLVSMLREAAAGDPGDGFLHFDTEGAQGPQAIVLPMEGLSAANERIARLYSVPRSSAHFGAGDEGAAKGGPPSRL